MKSFKKIIALLLVVATLCSMPVYGFAAKKDAAEAAPVEEEKKVNKFENVATMYLIYTSANPKIPHLWIYIENETDETLNIGPYKLEPHGAVSMGAWKDRGMGAGIHINLERYWVKDETYGRAFYIKTKVSRSELERVGKKLDRHNYWNWGLNCVWFALSIWNTCTVKFVPFLFSPRIALVFMFLYGARRPDFTIKKLTNSSKAYKYVTGGKLEKVYPGVLYTKTGV